jgi:hypothetical protein
MADVASYLSQGALHEADDLGVQFMKTKSILYGGHPDILSDIDSDATDISSDMESVLSIVAPTVSSTTSIQGQISLFAADEFITLLLEDEELRVLFTAAIQSDRVGPARFERDLRRLLNQYSVDLKEEAESNEEKAAVYLIRSRSRYLANDIRRKVTSIKDSDTQYENLKKRSDHKINSLKAVEQYLAESNPIDETAKVEDSNLRQPTNFLSEDSGNEAEISERLSEGVNSDSDFEEKSADDDITESQNYEKLPKLSMVKDFMTTSPAFSVFRENLRQFIQPASRSKLGRLLAKLSKPEHNSSIPESSKSKLRSLITDLDFISPGQIRISYQESSSLLNHLKGIVEELTKETWEWWPFKPRMPPLPPGYARLYWDCVSFRPLATGECTNGPSPVVKNAERIFPHMLQDELRVFHSKDLPRQTCVALLFHKHWSIQQPNAPSLARLRHLRRSQVFKTQAKLALSPPIIYPRFLEVHQELALLRTLRYKTRGKYMYSLAWRLERIFS